MDEHKDDQGAGAAAVVNDTAVAEPRRQEHTCIADIFPSDTPCAACEADKAEYDAQCAQVEAEQAQEDRDRYYHANDQEPH